MRSSKSSNNWDRFWTRADRAKSSVKQWFRIGFTVFPWIGSHTNHRRWWPSTSLEFWWSFRPENTKRISYIQTREVLQLYTYNETKETCMMQSFSSSWPCVIYFRCCVRAVTETLLGIIVNCASLYITKNPTDDERRWVVSVEMSCRRVRSTYLDKQCLHSIVIVGWQDSRA